MPIECQIQTKEQYKDSKSGFSAHIKLNNKNFKLKPVPGTPTSKRYTDANGLLKEKREYLSYLMHTAPTYSVTRTTGTDFENNRTVTTIYDLYESFRLISTSRDPRNSVSQKIADINLTTLYEKREELIPTNLLPEYRKIDEIPNPNVDYSKYNQFFKELRSSLKKTFSLLEEVISSDEVKTPPVAIIEKEHE